MSGSAQALANLPGNAQVIDNTGVSWADSAWWAQLQPGSWRGVGFVMDVAETHAGRRIAVHEYPYRDSAWVEDLGKLPRRFAIQAYLVGDDVYAQRDAMVSACELAGPGTLVHPTMGSVQVVLLDFAVMDRRERGRYVEIQMQFLLAGDVLFPSAAISSANVVSAAADKLLGASKSDLADALQAMPVVPSPATQVTGYTDMAVSGVNDPTRALNAVRGLRGYYGRFAGGSRVTTLDPSATVQSVLSQATTSRTAVLTAAAHVNHQAALL